MGVGHLNTLPEVFLFLQMPKGRGCCWFTFCPGFNQRVFQPRWLLVESPSCTSRHKISLFLGKKLILLLTRLSISVKAVVQQLCASWHLWFLLTQSCQTKITASGNPKHFRIHYLLWILHCRVWLQYIWVSQLQFLKLFTLKSLYYSAGGDIWK